ncbi:NAD-dependent epimerase [Saprospiraceae bacterium]|nr:NAD-dependent epimerase [Saprospiraceae bacterium]
MKILVTGSAGFIGFHLVNKLSERGFEVIGIDNLNDYYDVSLKIDRLKELGVDTSLLTEENKKVKSETISHVFYKMDLCESSRLLNLFQEKKFDVVINLAAQAGVRYSIDKPEVYIKSNLVGFANLLEACRQNNIKHLVYASSSSVYGMNKTIPFVTSESTDHPMSLYAATKKSNELMAHTYSHLYNLPTTGLRFFTVYGPWGRPDMALFLFTKAIFEGRPIKIFNEGELKRDFTYIDDIVEGVSRVIDQIPVKDEVWQSTSTDSSYSTAPYKIYNIGNSKPIPLLDFVSCIERVTGIEAKKEMVAMQAGDVKITYADVSELKRDVGYTPNTSLEYGVSKFVNWYKTYYKI